MVSFAIRASFLLFVTSLQIFAQGTPNTVTYEPDDGGYYEGYDPAKKLGVFDLSSNASNEPFRHLIKSVPLWDNVLDYRNHGIRAVCNAASDGKPRQNRYMDINESAFRDPFTVDGESFGTNPMYLPDPNRDMSAQGQTFVGVNGPYQTIYIDNVNEASRVNPFLLTGREIERRAKAAVNATTGYIRWDIEYIYYGSWSEIIKGRQVWDGGKYRHRNNGGWLNAYKDMDDQQFFNLVQERWSYIFTELLYYSKLYSNNAKVWMYGIGVAGGVTPDDSPFNPDGTLKAWSKPNSGLLWTVRNRYNNRILRDELSYHETSDFIPMYGMWSVLQKNANGYWGNTGLIKLREAPKTTIANGIPTRYYLTDLGIDATTGNRRMRISLHGQDGLLRKADQLYKVTFQHWQGNAEIDIPTGTHSVELLTSTPDLVWETEDKFMVILWNGLYASRYIEPTKLGMLNWEPAPRTYLLGPYPLVITDIFEQRIYDAMVAFTNLQNFGLVSWEAGALGKVNPMVRESLILAFKKIAPYKTHIENQSLVYVDVSVDGGQTWAIGGYPTTPEVECYNGWWMGKYLYTNQAFPMLLATYNTTQNTLLVAHMGGNMPSGNINYKIRFKKPNTQLQYTYDMSTTRELSYKFVQLP